MGKRMISAIAFTMLFAGMAHAGMILKQEQSSDDEGQRTRTVSEVRIEGAKARVDFLEMTENPFFQQGAYMLFVDEDTGYVVNPKDRTYARMDLEEMQNMGRMASQSEEQMHRQGGPSGVKDLQIRKELDEPGPAMLGFPTEHVVYDVTYTRPAGMQSGPMKMDMQNHETYEIWATRGFEDELSRAAAFKKRGPGMGLPGGSGALAQVGEALSRYGMPLKMVETTESRINLPGVNVLFGRAGGVSQHSKTTIEVTELRKASLPPNLFALPDGYTEVDLANPSAGTMPDLDRIPGGPGVPPGPGGPSTAPMPDLDKIPK